MELRITAQVGQHEIRPGLVVPTWAYNAQVPGPLIRLREGERVGLDHQRGTLAHRNAYESQSWRTGTVAPRKHDHGGTPHASAWSHVSIIGINGKFVGEPWLLKDTVNLRPMEVADVSFVADNPGKWLLHCHQSHHADHGLSTLIEYE